MSSERIVSEEQIDREELVREVPLFAGLADDDLRALADAAWVGTVPAGDEIIEEGRELIEDEEGLYLLVGGTVEVRRGSSDGTDGRLLRTLGPGDYFGEMALIDDKPRSASVYATSEVQYLALSRWNFHRTVRSHPDIAVRIMSTLAERLREAESEVI
jgi:CRP-like cAMP-binding protein